MGPLLTAVITKNESAANEWSQTEEWATLEQLLAATSGGGGGAGISSSIQPWTCGMCTFLNSNSPSNCEMCNLPR